MQEPVFISDVVYFSAAGKVPLRVVFHEMTGFTSPPKSKVLGSLICYNCCSCQALLIHNACEYPPDVQDTLDAGVPGPKGKILRLESEKLQKVLANILDLFLWLIWLVRVSWHLTHLLKKAKVE